ncbi:MAG: hypothetical protein ACI9VI_002042 [Candidatus Azotimanducaceae bacterium]|jgi:hypothetical protein
MLKRRGMRYKKSWPVHNVHKTLESDLGHFFWSALYLENHKYTRGKYATKE